ncbi:Hypothetical protein I595_2393 [Croceitalea dokdonensis DOKDO 023]|uniref:Uncharacterized protein n=1 Tax=Croceitalea dokdonensis DOKDO 023 TaxID=1300341 RepID=A0A0P7AT49_9FLAO|nr:Hypothetical protein I595_2393 [Croceitalea dokdonensis DOKDO 023]
MLLSRAIVSKEEAVIKSKIAPLVKTKKLKNKSFYCSFL